MRFLLPAAMAGLVLAGAGAAAAETVRFQPRDEYLDLSAELAFPEGRTQPVPAMVVVHGSGGLGKREAAWADFLRQQGIATLTLDYFTPRGITPQSPTQPAPAGDITQAIRALATDPRIDAKRIGIIGFSRGAFMALDASNDAGRTTGGPRNAVTIALYPTCRRARLEEDRTLPPVLILLGTEDSYTRPEECKALVESSSSHGRIVELSLYDGATHAWDSGYDGTFFHQSAGRMVTIRQSLSLTERARAEVLGFLKRFSMVE